MHTLAGQALLYAIQGHVVAVLADDDLGDQTGAEAPAVQGHRRQLGHKHPAFGNTRRDVLDTDEPTNDDPLRHDL